VRPRGTGSTGSWVFGMTPAVGDGKRIRGVGDGVTRGAITGGVRPPSSSGNVRGPTIVTFALKVSLAATFRSRTSYARSPTR